MSRSLVLVSAGGRSRAHRRSVHWVQTLCTHTDTSSRLATVHGDCIGYTSVSIYIYLYLPRERAGLVHNFGGQTLEHGLESLDLHRVVRLQCTQ